MLVLSRKAKETIVCGDIVITVVSVHGKTVRIGIDAPKCVDIRRGELPLSDTTPLEMTDEDLLSYDDTCPDCGQAWHGTKACAAAKPWYELDQYSDRFPARICISRDGFRTDEWVPWRKAMDFMKFSVEEAALRFPINDENGTWVIDGTYGAGPNRDCRTMVKK